MNVAATLSRFLQAGFQPQPARPQRRSAVPLAPEQRSMARRTIMTLDNRRLQLRVLRGWVWITRDGCPADVVLGEGEVFEQWPGARVLVQALEESELLIAGLAASAQNA